MKTVKKTRYDGTEIEIKACETIDELKEKLYDFFEEHQGEKIQILPADDPGILLFSFIIFFPYTDKSGLPREYAKRYSIFASDVRKTHSSYDMEDFRHHINILNKYGANDVLAARKKLKKTEVTKAFEYEFKFIDLD